MKNGFSKKLLLSSLVLTLSTSAYAASGFKIGLENTSDLGRQFAGGAAVIDDATVNYYNSAGLTYFYNPELAVPIVGVLSDTKFRGTATAAGLSAGPILADPFSGTGSAKTKSSGIIPSFHYVSPLNEKVFFGISVTEPYGLGSDYGKSSILRYAAAKAEALAVNIAPSLAFKVNDRFSIGAGPDFQYFRINLLNKVRTQGISDTDSELRNKGSDWSYGWHAGAMFQATDATRVGVSYRSKISHTLTGVSKLLFAAGTLNPVDVPVTNRHLKIDLDLPATTIVSVRHQIDPRWAGMVTADYTQWDVFKTVKLRNVANDSTSRTSEHNFKNTWHFAVGTDYQATDDVILRAGVGTDHTPTNNRDRSVIIPNADNYAVSVGARYKASETMFWDVGYSHAFIKKVNINHSDSASGTTETGRSRTTGDSLGVQLNWRFA